MVNLAAGCRLPHATSRIRRSYYYKYVEKPANAREGTRQYEHLSSGLFALDVHGRRSLSMLERSLSREAAHWVFVGHRARADVQVKSAAILRQVAVQIEKQQLSLVRHAK